MREIFDLYSYLKISGAQAAGRRLKAREAGIHVPVFLQADISVHCNLSCPGCENGYIHTKHQEELMTVNEWDVLFREAEKLGIRFFFLTGGEPLMEREILERAARYQNSWFLVFTKGTLLNEEYDQFFSDHRNLVPMLCLDACSDINLEKMGKSSYLYESLMYSMDALSRRDIVYGTSVTLTGENRNRVLTRGFLDGLNRRKCNGVLYLVRDEADGHGAGHGHERGLKDVVFFDFRHPGQPDAPAGRKSADFSGKTPAFLFLQYLGIVQSHQIEAFGKDHRPGHHRPRKAAPACLVYARDKSGAGGRADKKQPLILKDGAFAGSAGHRNSEREQSG